MFVSRSLLFAVLALSMSTGAIARPVKDADALRAQAEHDCYDDVQKLCAEFIPDEDRITACMKAKHAQLSPVCRKVFDQGMKTR